jgi:hypothetical protein
MDNRTSPHVARALHCPSWCTTDHDDPDQLENELCEGRHEHLAGVGGFWLHEIRTGGEDPQVFRPSGPLVEVALRQHEPVADGLPGRSLPHVQLSSLFDGWELALTSSECRSLAAMLVHGADRLEHLR